MPEKHSAERLECLQHATECELLAERASDPAARRSFLDIAERWRRIAGTYAYLERVHLFRSKSTG
jgi:hypothetical protein